MSFLLLLLLLLLPLLYREPAVQELACKCINNIKMMFACLLLSAKIVLVQSLENGERKLLVKICQLLIISLYYL